MFKPWISIIMPVYNLEGYVAESIDSVRNQTVGDWELIIVDDGSVDQTKAVVSDFAKEDYRIRYYEKQRSGVSAARNFGLDKANGDFITFLDGDDLWDPRFLEKCMKRFEEVDGDFIFVRFNRLMSDKSIKSVTTRFQEGSDSEMAIVSLLNGDLLLMGQFVVARALIGEQARFVEGCRYGEDSEFIIKLLTHATKTSYIDEELFSYRFRATSATAQIWDWTARIDAIRAWERSDTYLRNYYMKPKRCKVVETSQQTLGYAIYRFQYRLVKNGYYLQAKSILTHEPWVSAMQKFIRNARLLDKLKVQLVLVDNMWIWRCLTGFYGFLNLRKPRERRVLDPEGLQVSLPV